MRRLGIATALVAALLIAAPALAETQATILLRSGERVSGNFEDIQNDLVYIRISQDDERRIPVEDVVIIDFVGGTRGIPETELNAAKGSGDLLLLRDSTSWTGSLVDVEREGEGGERTIPDAPIHVVFRTQAGATERVSIDRVGRLYLGELPDVTTVEGLVAGGPVPTTGTATAPADPGAISVPATSQWTPTGVRVTKGQRVSFNAQGEIRIGDQHMAAPAGSTQQQYDPSAPIPQAFAGALIGRVGGSAPFAIGNQTGPLTMPADGVLYLGINEGQQRLADNTGAFQVTVNATPVRR